MENIVSESLKMPLKNKADYEEERIAALHSYNILDTDEEADFDDLTELAAAICNTPCCPYKLCR